MASTTSPFSILASQNPNSSVANDTEKQLFILKQPTYMIAIYSVAYSVVFFCALFGNLMVVTVVFRNRAMRTVTNCFIVNLAVADILVAVFNLPITLLSNLYLGKYVKQVVKFSVYKRKICYHSQQWIYFFVQHNRLDYIIYLYSALNFRCISFRQFKYAQASTFCNICNVYEIALMKNEFYFDYNIQNIHDTGFA